MKSQENIDLEVTQDGLRFAGIYSLKINDTNERKRAFASLVILSSLANFFMKQSLIVSGTKSLYKASKLSEEFEITDLYVNNWRLDIRLAMPGDYFYIPKSHFENEILPDFYVVATIDKDLKKPEFIGYISPDNLNKASYNSLYYRADFNDLGEMSDLLQELKQEKKYYCKEKDHRFFHTKILTYFDNEADNFTKTKLLNHLLNCQNCRTELINFCGFDIISKKLENYGDLFDDDSLNIIGALNAQDDDDEEEEKEEYKTEETPSKEKTEQGELIDGLFENVPKPAKPIDTKPFKNISEDKIEVLPSTNKERITLTEPDIFLQDIPPLGEEENKPNTQIKLNKFQSADDTPLTFTQDSPEPQKRISLADSIHDIPDEMFNSDFDETSKNESKSKRHKTTNNSQAGVEKIIVDYDEFGQPVYEESRPEDYKIVEEAPVDTFKKNKAKEADITDTFTKDKEEENYIEGSSETCNEELISNAPPQTKKKRKRNSFIPVILGLFVLFLFSYFIIVNPIFKHNQTEADIPSLNPDGTDISENNINDIISKNINSKTSFVKLKKINWVAQKSLLQDEGFKEYLQTIDKRFKVKFKLNSNSFTQAPFNNNVVVEIIVTPDGEIKSSRMASSSGIKELDKAIMDSIKEAADMLPIPAKTQANMQLSEYYIKIMIKL